MTELYNLQLSSLSVHIILSGLDILNTRNYFRLSGNNKNRAYTVEKFHWTTKQQRNVVFMCKFFQCLQIIQYISLLLMFSSETQNVY